MPSRQSSVSLYLRRKSFLDPPRRLPLYLSNHDEILWALSAANKAGKWRFNKGSQDYSIPCYHSQLFPLPPPPPRKKGDVKPQVSSCKTKLMPALVPSIAVSHKRIMHIKPSPLPGRVRPPCHSWWYFDFDHILVVDYSQYSF